MTAASSPFPAGLGHAWAKIPLFGSSEDPSSEDPYYHVIPRCVRRLWERFLKRPENTKATRFKITVPKLARILGVGVRCVFKALKWLKERGHILRYYEPARQDDPGSRGGYVIEIVLPLKGLKPKTPPKPKAKAKPTRPECIPIKPTAAQQPAHQAQQAAVEPPSSELSPEDEAVAQGFLDRAKANRLAAAAAKAQAVVVPPVKKTPEQRKAELDAWFKARAARTQAASASPDPDPDPKPRE
jgi:hypothetical protein